MDQSTGWTLLTSTPAWVRSCEHYVNISYFYSTTLPPSLHLPSLFLPPPPLPSLHLPFSLLPSCLLPPGTAAATMWTIHFEGRLFHSGLPHRGINSIELASEAMAYIQHRFYEDFPPVSVCAYSDTCSFIFPLLYVTSVLGCVYACVYDSVCLFGGIRRHSETKSYLMAIFTMGELVLLSVCALCTLDSTGNVSSEYTPHGAS